MENTCRVVSYRNSTSNHNLADYMNFPVGVVSYRNSTSNHNFLSQITIETLVVSYRNSTSNHNCSQRLIFCCALYLIEILHQTTTKHLASPHNLRLYLIEILHQTTTIVARSGLSLRCILSKFYIKPQLRAHGHRNRSVVSYRNSTSNHNCLCRRALPSPLYLIEILHQTTTRRR